VFAGEEEVMAASSSSGGGDRGGGAGCLWCSGVGVCKGRSERQGSRESSGFYMGREGEGEAGKGRRPAHLPLMAGGAAA
jgi:hypothetical protein